MVRTNVMQSKVGRILFVEDERSLVDMYKIYFNNKGYDFLTTDDIDMALHLTEWEQPDVILLDIIIPKKEDGMLKMDAEQGYDYLEKMKKNPQIKDIPVVVFTNLDTDKDRAKCKKMGADEYIFKGRAMPKEVLEVVEKFVKKNKERLK